jgi:N-acetylglucosaminyldiphosphoundecaprenol N-acetyl-beta-D-mannosaminyltransferase
VRNIPKAAFAHPRVNILGVNVSAINMRTAVDLADRWIATRRSGYICVTAVHAIMDAQSDRELVRIMNDAVINTPDGMPLSWIGRLLGYRQMDRVFGPDFMAELCRLSVSRGYRHFLYGGEPGVANALKQALERRWPGLQIVGTYTPPFRHLNEEEEDELIRKVSDTRPDILWVGLSTPTQVYFMAEYLERLRVPLMVGVGAAFDYHTGRIQDSPEWVKRSGLQWVHRLIQEPRRLWKRYLLANPAFVLKVGLQLPRMRGQHRDNRLTGL